MTGLIQPDTERITRVKVTEHPGTQLIVHAQPRCSVPIGPYLVQVDDQQDIPLVFENLSRVNKYVRSRQIVAQYEVYFEKEILAQPQTLRAAHQFPPTTQTLRAAHQSPPTTQRIFELLTSLNPSTLLSSTLPPTAIRVDDGTHLDSRRQTATAFRPRSILYFLSWLVSYSPGVTLWPWAGPESSSLTHPLSNGRYHDSRDPVLLTVNQVNVLDEVPTLHTNEPSSGTIAVVEDEPVDDQFPLAEAGDVSSGGKPIENSSLDWTQQTLRAAHQFPPTTQTLRAAHQSPPTTQRIFELLTSLNPSTLLSSTLPPTAIRVDDGTHLDSRRQTATAFRPRSILYFLSWLVSYSPGVTLWPWAGPESSSLTHPLSNGRYHDSRDPVLLTNKATYAMTAHSTAMTAETLPVQLEASTDTTSYHRRKYSNTYFRAADSKWRE
ncbi:hypothetical protein Pmani_007834 [Petrolisthes manimaculis]|uniref:Uncharacterized protein n=1 Tax=Petrolisthes manimaculis TaxID=1843537 RepID=A0AAE1Q7K8_9EUCA|nr:hypothetical protein Pmani_007834 [Petrolisthes manimaculis]